MSFHAAMQSQLRLIDGSEGLPSNHLAIINALQTKRGKRSLSEDEIIARPIQLFGNKITMYWTKIRDEDLRLIAQQINDNGGPLLGGHVTENTPQGSLYLAEVLEGPESGELVLNVWVYWANDEAGQKMANDIDIGVINEASICYWYDRNVCSITGVDYWMSPYYAGQEYEVTDPETGATETKLCFLWTLDNISFKEASLVYAGAYPGTRVGGEALAASANRSRFVMAASRDSAVVLSKTKPQEVPGKPPMAPEPEGEETVKVNLKKPDGSSVEVEHTEVQKLLDEGFTYGQTQGKAELQSLVTESLGLKADEITPERLSQLKVQAEAGQTFRQSLEQRLEQAHTRLAATPEKAEAAIQRAKRILASASAADLETEVLELEARATALGLPNDQQSREHQEEGGKGQTTTYVDYDAV